MNPKVNFFFEKAKSWKDEYIKLRTIMLDHDMEEELKWGVPCYTVNKTNVVLIHGFKNYCAILFHKGVLLKDQAQLLIQQTENVQSARQMRFTGLHDILDKEHLINAYILEAIANEKAGKKVELKKTNEYNVPSEFKAKLDAIPALKSAFEQLTPGRQRGYLLYFSSAKMAKTREDRVEKCMDKILSGKGLEDE
jgi:uncharacterized protein YdeI (YjbR/CyaY-like superfamily)